MYSVILVDDEYLELELLEKQVDWESLGFTVVGTAKNGRKGLEIVKQFRPDVLITDVKMPVMDGITLAQQVYNCYPETRIIFLSGYNQFDYLKAAFHVEAVDYLLKPVDIDELTTLMRVVKSKYDTEHPFDKRLLLQFIQCGDYDPCQNIINSVQRYVEAHYHEQFTVEGLSEYLNYSPNYIRSIFKKYTGETLLEYTTNLRMERATQMLQNTTERIRDISVEVGYSNPSYLCSQFFKKYGITPQQYRSRLKNEKEN